MQSGVVTQCRTLAQEADTMADWATDGPTRAYWLEMSAEWLKLAALFEYPNKPLPPVSTSERHSANF
jgi:hypothetical protein